MNFSINGTEYTLNEFEDWRIGGATPHMTGWYWSAENSESPVFPTALEAQQDAVRHANGQSDEDDGYQAMVSQSFNLRDYR